MCSQIAGLVPSATGFAVHAAFGIDALAGADTVARDTATTPTAYRRT
ncbi:MAG: hypothetical protein ACR2LV_04875 [Solirubrobacteraceae bacterium]